MLFSEALMLELASKKKFLDPMNEGIQMVRNGTVRYRVVLEN
ncbi:hypothetical protein GQ600_21784 [Phytophthora cactorum]|nr:hypothetical protein GQ600_21784 [Phytophthora cactorum]